MRPWLLDGNVLVALTIDSHIHHRIARDWFIENVEQFATCTITQGTLLRVHMKIARDKSAAAAWKTLKGITNHPAHRFWVEGFSYAEVSCQSIQGGKQVTDAWLAKLATNRNARIATFDVGLAILHKDVAVQIAVARN